MRGIVAGVSDRCLGARSPAGGSLRSARHVFSVARPAVRHVRWGAVAQQMLAPRPLPPQGPPISRMGMVSSRSPIVAGELLRIMPPGVV